MKKIFFGVILLYAVFCTMKAQILNPYDEKDFQLNPVVFPSMPAFDGEHEVFLLDSLSQWFGLIDNISSKVEVVSFPFVPVLDYTDDIRRDMNLPKNSEFDNSVNKWDFDGFNNVFVREYTSEGDQSGNCTLNYVDEELALARKATECGNIASILFTNTENVNDYILDNAEEGTHTRIIIPHSVLKYTIYLHCTSDKTSEKIDSMIFTHDYTRSRGQDYPFNDKNYGNQTGDLAPLDYDISLFPYYAHPNNYVDQISGQNTIEYNPTSEYSSINNGCDAFYPDNEGNQLYSLSDPQDFSLPAPYSQLGYLIRSGQKASIRFGFYDDNGIIKKNQGITQSYEASQNIDLRIINPSEKVIYNPSEVEVTASNLVFPCGYKFKTVRASYPNAGQVTAANSNFNQGETDLRKVYVPTNLDKSIYNLSDCASLTIQPDVWLWDAIINVNPGSTLIYDPNDLQGNYEVIDNGGTIIEVDYSTQPNYCTQCEGIGDFDHEDLEITTNTTWTTDHSILGTLTVKSGNTLTINGTAGNLTEILFSQGGQLIVEAGAKLITNYALFDVKCGQFWKGILVEGDPTRNHSGKVTASTYPHGYAKMRTSTIKRAWFGVRSAQKEDLTIGSGRIDVQDCTFIDNSVGIGMSAYSQWHYSYINNNTFNFTFDFPDQLNGCHVVIDGVKLLRALKGNHFLNGNTSFSTHPQEKTFGIIAYSSRYFVGGDTLQNEFDNLHKGIDNYDIGGLNQVRIQDAKFRNVHQGITFNGGNYAVINDNEFNIPSPPFGGSLATWGIYMQDAQGFEIKDNELYSDYLHSGNTLISNTRGILIQNANGAGGEVYRNKISKVGLAAVQSEQDNTSLLVDCNEFTNNFIDIGQTSGNLEDQGSCDPIDGLPRANRFSPNCNTGLTLNDGNINHLYKDGDLSTIPSLYSYYTNRAPSCVVGGFPNINCNEAAGDDVCADDIGGGMTEFKGTEEQSETILRVLENRKIRDLLSESNSKKDRVAKLILKQNKKAFGKKIVFLEELDQKGLSSFDLKDIKNLGQEEQEVLELLVNLKQKGVSIHGLDEKDKERLKELKNSRNEGGKLAQKIINKLEQSRAVYYPEPIKLEQNKNGLRTLEEENKTILETKVQPNPFEEMITIQSNESYIWQAYSVNGQLVKSGVGTQNTQINTSEWESGVYIIHITGSTKEVHKVIKL